MLCYDQSFIQFRKFRAKSTRFTAIPVCALCLLAEPCNSTIQYRLDVVSCTQTHAQTGWKHPPVGSVRPRQVNKAVQYSMSNTTQVGHCVLGDRDVHFSDVDVSALSGAHLMLHQDSRLRIR
jgi:hypothetical protein